MSISLVESITMFSRSVHMKREDLRLVTCDFYSKIFTRCKQNIAPLALSRNFDPNRIKAIAPQNWPRIIVDVKTFRQVISNLFNNAVKYAFDDPDSFVLEVEFKRNPGGSADLRVIDYGIGVSNSSKESIFSPGVREEEAKKKVPTGTGIGLSTVRKILDLHGITIHIENESLPTIFVLHFPKHLIRG